MIETEINFGPSATERGTSYSLLHECLFSKNRPAVASERYATLHLRLCLMMCRLGSVEFETSHNKDEHSKPRVAVDSPALLDTLLCAFRSYTTNPPFIPPFHSSSSVQLSLCFPQAGTW